ncbi:MAG: succinyl-diaminopimelate desuccinylase [Campylobacterales bacterium]
MNVVELAQELIRRPSITPDDGGILDFIRTYFPDFEAKRLDHEGVKNLLLTKKFGEGLHLAFAGHVDTVPAADGWSVDPFGAIIKDGFLYGRGAQDMKSGIAAFLVAVRFIQSFPGQISLILTSDEEGDGIYGTDIILAHMQQEGMLPDLCIVAEPTCEERFGDAIKVGRRGSVNGKIVIRGLGGHAAYPSKARNPIEMAVPLLAAFSGRLLDEGDQFFEPSRLVMTTIQAGKGTTNVIPHELTLLFNVRNSTKTTKDDIESFVRHQLEKAGISDYTLEIKQSSKPFITHRGRYADLLTQTLSAAIKEITGITPKHSTAGGTSDARYVAAYGVDVVEFGVRNDTIHAPNERIMTAEIEALKQVFSQFLAKLGGR